MMTMMPFSSFGRWHRRLYACSEIKGVSKSGALFQKVCQQVAHFSEKGVKKLHTIQGMKNYLQKRCVKKWSTFPKGVSKSGVLFQKVRQKVTHLY